MAQTLVDAILGLDGGLLAPMSAKEVVIASELDRGIRLMLDSLCDRLRRGVPGYGDLGRCIGRAYAAGLSGQPPSHRPPPLKSRRVPGRQAHGAADLVRRVAAASPDSSEAPPRRRGSPKGGPDASSKS